MNGNILMANKQVCESKWEVDGSKDSFYRIYYVYGGEVVYKYKGRSIKLKKNHLYIVPTNKPYKMRHNPEDPFQVMWFHLDYPIPLVRDLLEIEIKNDTVEAYLLLALEQVIWQENAIKIKVIESLVEALQEKYSLRKSYVAYIEQIVVYIDEHIAKRISNEDLAQLVGYNKNYLIKQFKNQIGLTPKQYIIKTRMGYARKYLMEGCTVQETAKLLGYNDPNIFSRDFKHYYNQSPSYYIGYQVP